MCFILITCHFVSFFLTWELVLSKRLYLINSLMYIFATTFECGQGIWPFWCMCVSVYICMFDTYSKAPVKYIFQFTITFPSPHFAPPFLFLSFSLLFPLVPSKKKKNLYLIVCPSPMEQMWFVLIYSYCCWLPLEKNKLFFFKIWNNLFVDKLVHLWTFLMCVCVCLPGSILHVLTINWNMYSPNQPTRNSHTQLNPSKYNEQWQNVTSIIISQSDKENENSKHSIGSQSKRFFNG